MRRSNSTNALERCRKFLGRKKNSFTGKYHLYTGEKLNWFQVCLRLETSVVPVILPWVIFCGVYGFLISTLSHLGIPVGFSEKSVLTNAVLTFNVGFTLLLVFRTNTAHERFWEGRQLWGALVNTVRNLAQGIYVVVKEQSPKDRLEKEATLRLLVAFAIAMKLHLRSEPVDDEQLASLMSEIKYFKLKDVNHPPLQISLWIRDYLQHQYEVNRLDIYQLTELHKLVDDLVDILGGCERILKTPLPLIYSIKLRQLLVIFCLILPLELVNYLHWWTGIVMAFVSFTLLSIEEIGSEIEEPFGHDPNDLPLNMICNTMLRNVEELISLAPSSRYD